MKKITFNNDKTYKLDNFSKNYDFDTDPYTERASITLRSVENMDKLVELSQSAITDIVIKDEETELFSAHDINAKVQNLNEYISNSQTNTNMSLIFNK